MAATGSFTVGSVLCSAAHLQRMLLADLLCQTVDWQFLTLGLITDKIGVIFRETKFSFTAQPCQMFGLMLWMTFPGTGNSISGKNFTLETIVRVAAFGRIHHHTCARSAICWCDECYMVVRGVLLSAGATCASGFRSCCVSSSFRLLSESDHSL